MGKGIIYYNAGRSCIVRLAVSVFTLRNVYDGPVTIISEKGEGHKNCVKVAKAFNTDIKEVVMPDKKKNQTMLNRTLLHTVTPYDITLNIDGDTVIRRDPSRLFNLASEFEFVVCAFCNWTSKSKKIRRRLKEWNEWYPKEVEESAELGDALNCGVYAWKTGAKWMQDWYKLAKVNRRTFIPDEKCCQLMIYKYPHYIADQRYNTSCAHAEINDSTHIIHYHGKKHCRFNEDKTHRYNSQYWYAEFEKLMHHDFIIDNIQHDRQLRKNLPIWRELKTADIKGM